MLFKLVDHSSIANQFIAELRDVDVQRDRMRFRRNAERLGQIFAYEISKTFTYQKEERETPLGIAEVAIPKDRIVLASILRAGLTVHQGMLGILDDADNAFISAYRKHHKDGTFEINLEYATCPDLQDSVLILIDSMVATGASMEATLKVLEKHGKPKQIHVVSIIASVDGVNYLKRIFPKVKVWVGDLDDELTAKSYIVPGIGDAGDLLFGEKLQE
ncbi:MAG: uracil phosphoribosyltransferase [Saprospiraceae bacterium]|nr:uracil phosphoribosyltransferase [Saprospiraceae bacterium]